MIDKRDRAFFIVVASPYRTACAFCTESGAGRPVDSLGHAADSVCTNTRRNAGGGRGYGANGGEPGRMRVDRRVRDDLSCAAEPDFGCGPRGAIRRKPTCRMTNARCDAVIRKVAIECPQRRLAVGKGLIQTPKEACRPVPTLGTTHFTSAGRICTVRAPTLRAADRSDEEPEPTA